MSTATTNPLRAMARLYRRKVEGASETLVEWLTANPEMAAESLDIPLDVHARLLTLRDPAFAACARLDEVDAAKRRDGKAGRQKVIRDLAASLGATARREGAYVHLDPGGLARLLAAHPAGELCFERPETAMRFYALRFSTLRAVLGECRTCQITELYLDADRMVVAYTAQGARGQFRLKLGLPQMGGEHVDVLLPEQAAAERAAAERAAALVKTALAAAKRRSPTPKPKRVAPRSRYGIVLM